MANLNAWLHKDHLTEEESNFLAYPATNGNLVINDIINDLLVEGMEIKAKTEFRDPNPLIGLFPKQE